MHRAKIPLATAAVVAIVAAVVFSMVSSSISTATQKSVEDAVKRAQKAAPSLELLRGMEITAQTAAMAREAEFAQALAKSGDEQRQAAFVAVQARNARLEQQGRKADLIAVVGASGKVVCRDLNINAMVDEDLKSKYPAVGKALEGVAVKDAWSFSGGLYHVGIAPIRGSSGIAGALIIGFAASARDAGADKDRVGTEIAYFVDKKVQASSWKKEGGESTEEKSLNAALTDAKLAEMAASGQVGEPVRVNIAGEDYLAAAGPLTGNISKSASGFVVLSSLRAAKAPFGMASTLVLLLGLVGVLCAVAAAVLTAVRFLKPLDKIESGLAEVINGNHDYQFEAPSPDLEGLANSLNVMMARLLGRPDPSDDELSTPSQSGNRWGGELAVESTTTGQHTSPENAALAQEEEGAYLARLFQEYYESRKSNGESVDGLTQDSFLAKVRKTEADLVEKLNARSVRFKVVVKDGQTTLKPVPIT
jgi:hypothetical protein